MRTVDATVLGETSLSAGKVRVYVELAEPPRRPCGVQDLEGVPVSLWTRDGVVVGMSVLLPEGTKLAGGVA